MLFAGCVEPCLFLEGPALHMLGCVEPCLFLEGVKHVLESVRRAVALVLGADSFGFAIFK